MLSHEYHNANCHGRLKYGGECQWGNAPTNELLSFFNFKLLHLGFFPTQVKDFVSESFLKSMDATMLEVTEVCRVLLTVSQSHEQFLPACPFT